MINIKVILNNRRLYKKDFLIKGSLTVEAALVFPIFLFAITAILYFIQIINIQERLQQGITQMALDTSKYAYVYQYVKEYKADEKENNKDNIHYKESSSTIKKVKKEDSTEAFIATSIDSIYFKMMLPKYVDEKVMNHSCIKDGMSGIHTFMSSFMKDGEDIDIILTYTIKIPIPIPSLKEIPLIQRVRLRGFCGRKYEEENNETETEINEETDETYVYITETGTVYHTDENCSHLRLSIEVVEFTMVEELRNEYGGKYYPCNLCLDEKEVSNHSVFIAKTGDRYHKDINCSGLKRTVFTINIKDVGDRTLCSRCSKK